MALGEWYYAWVGDRTLEVFYCEDCFKAENDLGNIIRLYTHFTRFPAECEGCGVDIEGFERLSDD